MKLHLFNWCNYLILSALTLLYVPQKFLFFQPHFLFIILFIWLITLYGKGLWVKGLQHILTFALCLFFVHFQANKLLQQAENVANLPKQNNIHFFIAEIIHQQDYTTVVIETKLQPSLPLQRIYVNWKVPQAPQLGEQWQGIIQLQPLSSRLNQGGFDRQQWYLAKKITARGMIKSATKLANSLKWREQKFQQVYQQTTALSQQGAILALAFGERAWIKQQSWQLFQKTNTAHLIAISGLHIGLIFSVGFFICRAMQFFLPTRWISPTLPILFGGICAILYSELAGFSIPTLRAIIALCLIICLRFNRYHYSVWQYLRLTVGLLCFLDPFMLLLSSFWLSVSAVTCLILWYKIFPLSLIMWRQQPLSQLSFVQGRYFYGLLHLQLGLLCLFTPIQLLIFGGISSYSLLANLVIVPLYSLLVIPCLFFALFTGGFLHSWQLVNQLIQWSIQYLTLWQQGWITVSRQNIYFLTALLALLIFIYFAFLLFQQRKSQQSAVSFSPFFKYKMPYLQLNREKLLQINYLPSAIVISLGLIFCCIAKGMYLSLVQPQWRMETFDVGQGVSTLIVKNKRAILYDTGAGWKGGSMALLEVIPYLQRQGLQLDKVILSHDDNDHAGGIEPILQSYPQVELITSSQQIYRATAQQSCITGKEWQWNGLHIQAMSPNQLVNKAKNEDSCVLLISDHQYKILLTGDANTEVESRIAAKIGHIDVLQVGHHGSKTATSELLLQHTQPKIAIISSGRNNPWKLPHFSVWQRLKQYHIARYNTARDGQVSVLFYQNEIKVNIARNAFSPWYSQVIGEIDKKE